MKGLVTTFLETAGLKVKINSFPAPIHGVFSVKTTFFYLRNKWTPAMSCFPHAFRV